MGDADGSAGEVPVPGPVVCHRCGATFGRERGFLPERELVNDGKWTWICVDCATGAADQPE